MSSDNVKRPKQISITYTDELYSIITDIREKLIEIDRIKYGKKFVEYELNKRRGSRYSNEAIIRMLVRAGYDVMKKDLQLKYAEARNESGEHDNEITMRLIEMFERKNNNPFASIYDLGWL